MIARILVGLSFLAPSVLPSTAEPPAGSTTFKIVVNASNPVSTLSRADAASYFLKRKAKWPNGLGVAPLDLSSTSPLRTVFCRDILDKSIADVMHYWQQRIFSGSDSPPPVKSTDEEVIAFVQSNPGAIGYVSAAVSLPKDVKSVTVNARD